jgi:glucose-6-phosphate isomerase
MKNRSTKSIFLDLKKLSKSDNSNKKLSFKFESEFLDYQSYLQNFSSQHYKLFEELALKLNLQDSINDLFNGEIVNKTENRQALHHQYRSNQTTSEFDFKKITEPFIKRIKQDGYKNIITFGIGGSYEGPKLLQEFTNKGSCKFNYYFISGPDKDEFDAILKPISDQKNFYIFSSKSLSTDETLSCLKWLGAKRDSTNSIVITANSEKAKTLGFNENSIVPFPETVGGRYSIWSPISLSAALENNFSKFLKGGLSADKMLLGSTKIDLQYQKFIKILAFSDLWFSNFLNKKNRVVLSYNWKLRSLVTYIQQLEMESLGKRQILNLYLKLQVSQYLEVLALLLNTPIFNCCIRVQQNSALILSTQPLPIAHYQVLKLKDKLAYYPQTLKGQQIFLKKQIAIRQLIFSI